MKIPFEFFVTSVISCQQLLTTDDTEDHPRDLKGMYENSISVFLLQVLSAVYRCWQLMSADDNQNQPREMKFGSYINIGV